jgi:5-methyltetrahydrofolate--homocysteine methyltransferase
MTNDLTTILADLNENEALQIVKQRSANGEDPLKIMEDARRGMEIVGNRFASGEYFIPELVYSGEILREISDILKPLITQKAEVRRLGEIIIGTVAGDIHDIGKDIVVFMLDVNGFEVYDLGIDVPVQKFVDKIKETKARMVGLSGFLTLAFDSMKATVEAIKSAYPNDDVRIMIGGGQIDEEIRKYTGADEYGKDAMAAVSIARKWIQPS